MLPFNSSLIIHYNCRCPLRYLLVVRTGGILPMDYARSCFLFKLRLDKVLIGLTRFSSVVSSLASAQLCLPVFAPSSFPSLLLSRCVTSGSPPLCPRSPVPSGHPTCAFWCRSSTPALVRLLWLLAVFIGLADHLHSLPPLQPFPLSSVVGRLKDAMPCCFGFLILLLIR